MVIKTGYGGKIIISSQNAKKVNEELKKIMDILSKTKLPRTRNGSGKLTFKSYYDTFDLYIKYPTSTAEVGKMTFSRGWIYGMMELGSAEDVAKAILKQWSGKLKDIPKIEEKRLASLDAKRTVVDAIADMVGGKIRYGSNIHNDKSIYYVYLNRKDGLCIHSNVKGQHGSFNRYDRLATYDTVLSWIKNGELEKRLKITILTTNPSS